MERSLRNRLTFGPLMLGALLGVLLLDHYLELWTGYKGIGIFFLLMVVLPIGAFELATLFAHKNSKPYRFISIAAIFSLLTHAFLSQFPRFEAVGSSSLAFIIMGTMFFAALRLAVVRQIENAIPVMAGTVLATLYLGGMGWFLMALRVKTAMTYTGFASNSPFQGTTMTVVMILLTVKFTDIGAYFGGRTLGRHKLIPWLSPGKTWEGLICGVLTAGGVGALCAPWMVNLGPMKGLLFGIVMGAVGQAGDLLESMMKRDAQVKDSGSLIPGFGGVLDITDSPLLAAPFAYLLYSIF